MENKEEIFAQDWVKKLLAEPLLARLGTANPETAQPHVTPVWFAWDGERLVYQRVYLHAQGEGGV